MLNNPILLNTTKESVNVNRVKNGRLYTAKQVKHRTPNTHSASHMTPKK